MSVFIVYLLHEQNNVINVSFTSARFSFLFTDEDVRLAVQLCM